MIHYQISLKNPHAHLFEVVCTIPSPDPKGQTVYLPAWIPGSYLVRDFAKHIVTLTATRDGGPIALEKLDKQTWLIPVGEGEVVLSYEVYAFDTSVRSAYLDATRAFINGTSVFLGVTGQESVPCAVTLTKPVDCFDANAKVATAMPVKNIDAQGFGDYESPDYDELLDHPFEISDFDCFEFTTHGVKHDIVISGAYQGDVERLCQDVEKICAHHIAFFKDTPPVDYYLFLLNVTQNGYGGLEHRASTSLICSRKDLPVMGDTAVSDDYATLLGLFSHEYFHTWNVKRIKPETFLPYDLTQENYTELLWAFEGFTSYYDDLALVRTGIISPQAYLNLLAKTATRVWRNHGRHKQTIAESSFDAWTKFYQADENAVNAVISYYAKGTLISLALDLFIRQQTEGEASLDLIMRDLWQQHGKPGVGVTEQSISNLVKHYAGEKGAQFLQTLIHSTEDVALETLLKPFGVSFECRQARNVTDLGGETSQEPKKLAPLMGVRMKPKSNEIAAVFDGSAAQQAGLSAKDSLVAVDNQQIVPGNLAQLFNFYEAGATVRVHYFRHHQLHETEVVLQAPPKDTITLRLASDENEGRAKWLHEG